MTPEPSTPAPASGGTQPEPPSVPQPGTLPVPTYGAPASPWKDVKSLGPAGFLAAGALFLPPLGTIALFATAGVTTPWLREHGHVGLVVYVVAFAVLAGMALLPTYAQSALGGYVFGMHLGIVGALLGFVGGAVIGYEVARRASGDRVEKLIAARPKWRVVRDALVGPAPGAGARRGFWKMLVAVSLLRMPPNSPFAFTNLLMASVQIPRAPYLIGTAIGMLPRTAIAVGVGASIKQWSKDSLEEAAPNWVWYAGVGVTIAVAVVVCVIAQRAINRLTAQTAPVSG